MTDNTKPITYDQFVKDFLLPRHIQSLTLSSSGRVYFTLTADCKGRDGTLYPVLNPSDNTTQQYCLDVPDVAAFLLETEHLQLEQGIPRSLFVPIDYKAPSVSGHTISNLMSLALFGLLFFSMFSGRGGVNGITKAMGIGSKNIEIVKKTGVGT